MSKAAIDSYNRANSGVGLNAVLRRIDIERKAEARRNDNRNKLVDTIGSIATTGTASVGDFKKAKLGGYTGTFMNFISATPDELSPFIELGNSVAVEQSEPRGGLLDTIKSFADTVLSRDAGEELGQQSFEGGHFFGRKP